MQLFKSTLNLIESCRVLIRYLATTWINEYINQICSQAIIDGCAIHRTETSYRMISFLKNFIADRAWNRSTEIT